MKNLRFIIYVVLFFWLLSGCQSSVGVTTKVQRTKTLTRTSTALDMQLQLERSLPLQP